MPFERVDNPREGGLRRVVRGLTVQLAVPQGFTLSVGGTLAVTIGQHGTPGLLDVWLFAVGAGVSFCLLAVLSGSALQGGPVEQVSLPRAAVLNVLPVVVIPAAVGCAALVSSQQLDFLLAGALASGLYVLLLGLVATYARGTRSK
jgi:hypothetical protein